MRSIFISYRREDAEGQAGRLFDDLAAHFGKDSVFMDVVDIEPGRDFRRVIDQNVASCIVLLAVVGKGWLDAKDQAGRRRIDNPNDFVRLETASALKRDIPVIPVLVQGAGMPLPEQLPDDLKELAFRNAVEITHTRWDSDTQLLIKALDRYIQAEKQHEEDNIANVRAEAKPTTAERTGALRASAETHKWRTGPTVTPRQKTMSRVATLIISALALVLITGGYLIYLNYHKAAEEQRAKEAAQMVENERARIAPQRVREDVQAAVDRRKEQEKKYRKMDFGYNGCDVKFGELLKGVTEEDMIKRASAANSNGFTFHLNLGYGKLLLGEYPKGCKSPANMSWPLYLRE
jgi:hypothetical protein